MSFYYISKSFYRLAPLQNGPLLTNFLTKSDQKLQKYNQAYHLLISSPCAMFFEFCRYRTMHTKNVYQQPPNTILWLILKPHQLKTVYVLSLTLKSSYSFLTSSTASFVLMLTAMQSSVSYSVGCSILFSVTYLWPS